MTVEEVKFDMDAADGALNVHKYGDGVSVVVREILGRKVTASHIDGRRPSWPRDQGQRYRRSPYYSNHSHHQTKFQLPLPTDQYC